MPSRSQVTALVTAVRHELLQATTMSPQEFDALVEQYRAMTSSLMRVYGFLKGGWSRAVKLKARHFGLPDTFDTAELFLDEDSTGIPKADYDHFLELHNHMVKALKSAKSMRTRIANRTAESYAKDYRQRKVDKVKFNQARVDAEARFNEFEKLGKALTPKFAELESLAKRAYTRHRGGGAGKLKSFEFIPYLLKNPPAGFAAQLVPSDYGKGKDLVMTKGNPGTDQIVIRVGAGGDGHTSFDTPHGRRTFDRLGVDDSFSLTVYGGDRKLSPHEVSKIVRDQVKKAEESRVRVAESVKIVMPRHTALRTPAQIAELAQQLKSGKAITLAPSGFGTGYTLATNPRRLGPDAKNAPPDVVKQFGVGPLFYVEYDHD